MLLNVSFYKGYSCLRCGLDVRRDEFDLVGGNIVLRLSMYFSKEVNMREVVVVWREWKLIIILGWNCKLLKDLIIIVLVEDIGDCL